MILRFCRKGPTPPGPDPINKMPRRANRHADDQRGNSMMRTTRRGPRTVLAMTTTAALTAGLLAGAALPAGAGERVDHRALKAEEAELKRSEQTGRPRPDDDRVGIRGSVHPSPGAQPCLSGTETTSPSSLSSTLIWQERRELGFTS